MRTMARIVIGALAAVPLSIAGAGLAAADDNPGYQDGTTTVGPGGVVHEQVISDVDENGNVVYYQQQITTGPDGVTMHVTASTADGSSTGGSTDGTGSSFGESTTTVGADGVTTSGTSTDAG